MKKVLILGGYGNFGRKISTALTKVGIPVIIAGRNTKLAESLAVKLRKQYPGTQIEISIFDIEKDLSNQLKLIKPTVVINTCGPFQTKDYTVAFQCINFKIHYIDLSDGRDYVNEIISLDAKAKEASVIVVSGASTVPGLSSAVLEKYKNEFSSINSLIYGITPGQKAPRGLATTEAILSYLGKRLKPAPYENKPRYGWQNLYRQKYPIIGKRWMANCDIPDIDLFPKYYKIKHIQFSAGMENSLLHLGIWLTSWLIRLGTPLNLQKHAKTLLALSHFFDQFGTEDGGMHMLITGTDLNGKEKTIKWFIIAKSADGPQIPTIPAIILTKKIIAEQMTTTGAIPCIGLISLDEYMNELKGFNIEIYVKN